MSLERMDDLFGVTEVAKAFGDEETGNVGPTTGPPGKPVPQVQETTAEGEHEHMEEVKL